MNQIKIYYFLTRSAYALSQTEISLSQAYKFGLFSFGKKIEKRKIDI